VGVSRRALPLQTHRLLLLTRAILEMHVAMLMANNEIRRIVGAP
jgi:hypothetical protein